MSDLDKLPRFKPKYAALHAAWVEALESGKYDQTTGTLHDSAGFCCLGVLCDVARKRGMKVDTDISREDIPDNSDVTRWTGFKFADPDDWYGDNSAPEEACSLLEPLTRRNDGSRVPQQSFKQISKIVSKRMEPEAAS